MDVSNIDTALELVEEEAQALLSRLQHAGAEAFQAGNADQARQLAEKCKLVQEFIERIKQLRSDWQHLSTSHAVVSVGRPPRSVRQSRRKQRLSRGLRTPEEAFRRPILEALVELGGRATVDDIMSRVEMKMMGILNTYDREELPSGRAIRWKNTAQWCRKTMVNEGLLLSNSPMGVWEISEAGRRALESGEV